MAKAFAVDSQQLALDLYHCLKELDPSRIRQDVLAGLRQRLQNLRTRIDGLLARWPDEGASPLRAKVGQLAAVLAETPTAVDVAAGWAEFRARLQSHYEDLAKSLARLDVHVPSLRPTNYRRNAFHVFCALSVLALIELVLVGEQMVWVASAFVVFGWSMEISRRVSTTANRFLMWIFGPVAHPHEAYRINSSTWYVTALFIVALMSSQVAAAVAVVVLGFGDPAAAIIGRRFGKTKLINGRSLEGTLTFVAVAALVTFAVVRVFHGDLGWAAAAGISGAAAVGGALAELLSRKIDDNLSIPVVSAAAVVGFASLIGVAI